MPTTENPTAIGLNPKLLARGKNTLSVKILAMVMLIFLGSLIGAGTLSFLKFERVFVSQTQVRYDSVGRETLNSIDRSLGVGLSLSANHGVQIIIDKVAQRFQGEIEIFVHDLQGNLLFKNDGATLINAQLVPQNKSLTSEKFEHVVGEDHLLTIGNIILGPQTLGTLTIQFNAHEITSHSGRLKRQLIRSGAFVVILFLPILAFLVFVVLGSDGRGSEVQVDGLNKLMQLDRDNDLQLETTDILGFAKDISDTVDKSAYPTSEIAK